MPEDPAEPTLRLERSATQAVTRASSPPELGVANYQVGGEIARGGMGSVLEAEDGKLKRTVAVKVMGQDAEVDPVMRERFVREAEVLAMLAHPNIVPVYDIVWEDGLPLFYAMKKVQGQTLQAILNALRDNEPGTLREFTLDRLLQIFRKVCDAVAFAHSKGILHRDLKPENIMVGEFGEVLVMDWGIAKTLGRETLRQGDGGAPRPGISPSPPLQVPSSFTLQGSVMGTPQYMSPEQAQGQVDELDERSDIYALGAILYAILTLRPPVEGKTAQEVVEKVRSGQLTAPTAFQTSSRTKAHALNKGGTLEPSQIKPLHHLRGGRVPAGLSSVAMHALQLDKNKRYPSVTALSGDIEAYQAGYATRAQEAGAGRLLMLLINRHKGIFSTSAVASVIVISLAVWFVFHLRIKEQRARTGEASAIASEAVAVRKAEESRRALAQSKIFLAEAALHEGNCKSMQAALQSVPDDLRDSTWSYLMAQSDTSIARVRTTHPAQIECAAANPRQPAVFAVADGTPRVTVMNVRTGERLLEFVPGFEQPQPGLTLAFSPDGGRIAVGRTHLPGGIVIHSAQDGTKLMEWEAPPTRRLEFSPGGESLLQEEIKGQGLILWDTTTGHNQWAYKDEACNLGTFAPDGKSVLTYGIHDHLVLRDAADGSAIRTVWRDRILRLAMHPEGNMALLATETNGVLGINLGNSSLRFQVRPKNEQILHLACTTDGRRFITAATNPDQQEMLHLWDASSGTPIQTLLGGVGEIRDLAVHPGSQELLVASPDSRVWNLAIPHVKCEWKRSDLRAFFWGSDDLIFGPGQDSYSALLDLKTDPPTLLWRPPEGNARGGSVSADGKFAVVGLPGHPRDNPFFLLRNPGPNVELVSTFHSRLSMNKVRLSPDGSQVVTITVPGYKTELIDTASSAQPHSLENTDIKSFHDLGWISPTRLVGVVTAKAERGVIGSEEQVILWDTTNGKIIHRAPHPTAMDVLVAAPEGGRFAEAGEDKMLRIRDGTTLAVQREFRVNDSPTTALAWHPTQPIVATASSSRVIRLWDVATGRLTQEIRGPLGTPTTLSFSPSGKRLAASATDGSTHVWEIE